MRNSHHVDLTRARKHQRKAAYEHQAAQRALLYGDMEGALRHQYAAHRAHAISREALGEAPDHPQHPPGRFRSDEWWKRLGVARNPYGWGYTSEQYKSL